MSDELMSDENDAIRNHPVFLEVAEAYADCMDDEIIDKAEMAAAMQRRQLQFRASQSVTPVEAAAIMARCCPEYNAFEAECLLLFPDDCRITLAREMSVCIYVALGLGPLPSLSQLQADEYDLNLPGEVRVWWD